MQELGLAPREPHITCEICHGVLSVLRKRDGYPAAWFMNRRNPPGTGWRISWPGDGTVIAYCPSCKPVPAASQPRKQP